MPKAKSTAAVKGDEAETIVLNYLKQQNRPYNSTDISLNLNGQVTKPVTQKCLLSLSEKNLILKKEYGKITVFCFKQDDKEVMTADQLSSVQLDIKAKREQLSALKFERKRQQSELDGLLSAPMNSELDSALSKAQSDGEKVHNQLLALQSKGTNLVTKEEMGKVEKSNVFWRKLWIGRRSTFKDLWDSITESMDSESSSELRENLGIDFEQDLENEKKYKMLM